jgi:DNA polymerase/3'-5' exonuclease PolX
MNAATTQRIDCAEAKAIAMDVVGTISDSCERIEIAGSIRRRKPLVKDIEIVFVPAFGPSRQRFDFFTDPAPINLAEAKLARLVELGLLVARPNVNGVPAWGPKNKLGIHCPSGMPVDLFTATPENFFNYLVCRTGGEQNNIRIAAAAKAMGWKWNPYGIGFSRIVGLKTEVRAMQSEREVFDFVGLPYLEPWQR